VEGEARTARVIAAGRIYEEHIRRLAERAHRGLEQRSFAQREQTRLVRCARLPRYDDRFFADRGGRPRRVARAALAAAAAGEADEDAADSRSRSELPGRRVKRAEPELLLDQLLARLRPRRHERILAPWTLWSQLPALPESVWDAIAAVPRANFVPAEYGRYAAADAPIPISHDQVTTQPSLVARMVEAFALTGDERVLEIG
jgi:hypothetical protein